jgi:hypothetical protein
MKDYNALYEKYKDHFDEWCRFDIINIGDRAMQTISQKHWTVARLHDLKRELFVLGVKKTKIKNGLIDKIVEKSPVNLDKKTLDTIDNSPNLEAINIQIKDCEFLIKYLEDMVKVMIYINQDVKNCIDTIKLETQ